MTRVENDCGELMDRVVNGNGDSISTRVSRAEDRIADLRSAADFNRRLLWGVVATIGASIFMLILASIISHGHR